MLKKLFGMFAMCALACALTACSGPNKEPVMEKPKGVFAGEEGSDKAPGDSQAFETVD